LTFDEVERYIKEILSDKKNCLFAIYTHDEKFIGTVKIGHIDWRTGTGDMGIMIGNKEFWGKGIAKESLFLASKYAFDVLCLRKLTGGCVSHNIAMLKAFQSLGYLTEGILRKKLLISGEYNDHVLFGIFKHELKAINQ
jgi:RimJ/RimL family protein N-acetyltransferase